MNITHPKVTLTLRQEPEIYYGEPTGKNRWLAVAQDTRHPTASVPGRGYTRTDAIADCLRASLDHHVVVGIDQDDTGERGEKVGEIFLSRLIDDARAASAEATEGGKTS
jgi:hypothetical protein